MNEDGPMKRKAPTGSTSAGAGAGGKTVAENDADETRADVTDVELLADLAEVVLTIARKLSARESSAEFDGVIRLSGLESMVMRFIDRQQSTSPSRISSELGLLSANTSAALRSLESHGLVTRVPDPVDKRSVLVRPTELAAQNLQRVRSAWSDMLRPVLPDGSDVGKIVAALTELDADFTAEPQTRPGTQNRS